VAKSSSISGEPTCAQVRRRWAVAAFACRRCQRNVGRCLKPNDSPLFQAFTIFGSKDEFLTGRDDILIQAGEFLKDPPIPCREKNKFQPSARRCREWIVRRVPRSAVGVEPAPTHFFGQKTGRGGLAGPR